MVFNILASWPRLAPLSFQELNLHVRTNEAVRIAAPVTAYERKDAGAIAHKNLPPVRRIAAV
jgi:hypothetical protein